MSTCLASAVKVAELDLKVPRYPHYGLGIGLNAAPGSIMVRKFIKPNNMVFLPTKEYCIENTVDDNTELTVQDPKPAGKVRIDDAALVWRPSKGAWERS